MANVPVCTNRETGPPSVSWSARQLAHLRAAATALLHHDTPTNRAHLWRLVHPDDWVAECEEFGCTDPDHSSRYGTRPEEV